MPSRNFRRDSNAFAAATTSPPTTNRSVSRRSAPSPASPFPAPSPQSDSRSPMSTPRTPSVLRTLLPACLRTQPVVPPPPGASRDGLPLATCASPGKHTRLRKEVPASCAGEKAAAPQHHVIAATAVSPLPHVRAAAIARTPARIRLHSQEWCAALRSTAAAGAVRWQCAGNEDRQTGGSGRQDRARGTTARRSCRGCSPAREAATTRAAPEAGRRVRGGGQPAEQQRQLQAARQRKRQGGARAAGQSGTREWRERGRTRGTAAGQVGAQGATSQQPR